MLTARSLWLRRLLLLGLCLMLATGCPDGHSARAQDPAATPGAVQISRRVALVIGNAAYGHTSGLTNPINDARAMAKLFAEAGFSTVEAKTDLGINAFRRALADFEVVSRDADMAIVYYSGHGLEFRGQNYLVPIDATMERDVDVKDETVPLDRVLEAVAGAKRLKLIILDSCRTDPFKGASSTKSMTRGLAAIEPSDSNELIAYAAKAGTVAADGDPGGNSPYTAALLKRLTTPGLDVELALRRVRDDVMSATHREQEPFLYGSLGGDEVPLVARPAEVVVLAPPATMPKPAASPEKPKPIEPKTEKTVVLAAPPDLSIAQCDRLAAAPSDATRPAGTTGIRRSEIDTAEAIPACRAALNARPNDPRLSFQLARAMQRAGGSDAEVIVLYRVAADGGNALGMNDLGRMYETGRGVAPDYSAAALWYRKAAEAGNPGAMNNLGRLYARGKGVAVDYTQAMTWFRKSADGGNGFAMNSIGLLYENGRGVTKDYAEAMAWFRKSADTDNRFGIGNIGWLYQNGWGVDKNYSEAATWYRKAIDAGDSDSMGNLGWLYVHGWGVDRNYAEAMKWFKSSAQGGNAFGMNGIGYLYEKGEGVDVDYKEAMVWFRKSADLGNKYGMNNIGSLYQNGLGVKTDYSEDAKWYRNAADADSPEAMLNLGKLYENGWGVNQSYAEAINWYRKAADAGEPSAGASVKRLEPRIAKSP